MNDERTGSPPGPIRTEALIRDLAIILRGCLHPSAEIGPAPRLAANRIRDVLGITPGELVAGVEDKLTTALGGRAQAGQGTGGWHPDGRDLEDWS